MNKTLPTCQVFFDMHMPGTLRPVLQEFDADDFAERLAGTGAGVVHVFAKCLYGHCYYPTRVGTRHPGLEGDFLGDAVRACQAKGLKVIAYLSVHVDDCAGREHPDWRGVLPDGSPNLYRNQWHNVCSNTGYRDHYLDLVTEVLGHVGADGLWFDGTGIPGHCYCAGCRALFEQETGRALTPEDLDDESRDWRAFALGRETAFRQAIADCAAQLNRDIWIGPVPLGTVPYLDLAPTVHVFTEAEVWPRGMYRDTWAPMIRGLYKRRLGVQYQAITTLSLGGWGEYAMKGARHLRYEAALSACQGAWVCLGKNLHPDGTLYGEVTDTYRDVFGWLKPYLPFCGDDRGPGSMAVVADNRERPGHIDAGLAGCAAVGLARHIPFDILPEDVCSREGPSAYPLWLFADREVVPSGWEESLPEYLEGGGRLIVTGRPPMIGETNLLTWLGLLRDGAQPALEPVEECYARFNEGERFARHYPYLLPGPFWRLDAQEAETEGELHWLMDAAPERIAQRSGPCGDPVGASALFRWQLGAGCVVYIPYALFGMMWGQGHEHLYEMAQQLVWEQVGDKVPFEIGEQVPLTAYGAWRGSRYLLHLINEPVRRPLHRESPPPFARHFVPLRDIPVVLRMPGVKKVWLQPKGTEIATEEDDAGRLVCRVPVLEDYAVLVVDAEV